MSTLDQGHNSNLALLEAWIINHANWLALATITAALGLRLVYADLCYLNPDEASHFAAASTAGWYGAYQASLTLAHPPLFILVLHSVLLFGRSELLLRMPSIVGGTVALWFTFAWIRCCLGEIPALAGLGFMAVSSASIAASTEVRQYGLLLCFVCGALYATERALSEHSTFWAIVQGLFLAAALLTHYTAIVVIASLGFYAFVRSIRNQVPRRVFFAFCLTQLVLAVLLYSLYIENVRGRLPFGPRTRWDYLDRYYYTPGSETALEFVRRSISDTFLYLVGMRHLSLLFALAFVVGMGGIALGRVRGSRFLALLIATTFCLGFVAALFRVFPFAGSRHQAYLLPFFSAAVAATLACFPRKWVVPALGLGVLIATFIVARCRPDNNPRTMQIGDMTTAIRYIEAVIPQGSPIFADGETREVLKYYLPRSASDSNALPIEPTGDEGTDSYRVIVSRTNNWAFPADTAIEQVEDAARIAGVPAGDPLRMVSVSWMESPLASRLPIGEDHRAKEFGRISVIEIFPRH